MQNPLGQYRQVIRHLISNIAIAMKIMDVARGTFPALFMQLAITKFDHLLNLYNFAALLSSCVPVALSLFVLVFFGHRTFSLFHFVIAINLRVWELPGFLSKHISSCGLWRVAQNYSSRFWSTFEVRALLLAVYRSCVQIWYLLLEIKLVIFPQYDYFEFRRALHTCYNALFPDSPKRCAGTLPSLHSLAGPVTSEYPSPICMCRASASHATLELPTLVECVEAPRVAENGSLSARAQLAVQIFIKRVFTIFATNASFLA